MEIRGNTVKDVEIRVNTWKHKEIRGNATKYCQYAEIIRESIRRNKRKCAKIRGNTSKYSVNTQEFSCSTHNFNNCKVEPSVLPSALR